MHELGWRLEVGVAKKRGRRRHPKLLQVQGDARSCRSPRRRAFTPLTRNCSVTRWPPPAAAKSRCPGVSFRAMPLRMFPAEPPPAALPHRSAPIRLDSEGFAVAVLPARPYDVTYVSDHHTIGFTVERQAGVGSFASDRRRLFQADPWRLAFTPAGCEVFSASRRGGEYVVLSIAPEVLAQLAPWIDQGRLPQFTNMEDPPFTSLGIALRRAACSSVAGDDLSIRP